MRNTANTQAILSDFGPANKSQAMQKLNLFLPDGSQFLGAMDSLRQSVAAIASARAASLTPIVTATAIGTAAKTTAAAEPAANSMVLIQFTNGNSAGTPTVAFNGGTARAIQLGGTASAAGKITLAANGIAQFFFDGTVLHQIGVYS